MTLILLLVIIVIVGVFVLVPKQPDRSIRTAGIAARRGSLFDRKGRMLAFDSVTDGQFRRSYPAGETTANLIGFVGGAGLEYALDSILKPRSRVLKERQAAANDVYLAVDLDLQLLAFRQLHQYVAASRAARGSAVIINASTGEVLALADYPGFDPYRRRLYPPEVWRCHAAMDDFEPGAAFGIVTLLATIMSADPALLVTGAESLLARRLDPALFIRAAETLGFGRPTGIEMVAEAVGSLPDLTRADTARYPNALLGYGLRASLLQLARAYALVAANSRHRPFLVARIEQNGKLLYDNVGASSLRGDRTPPAFKDSVVRSLRTFLARTQPVPNGQSPAPSHPILVPSSQPQFLGLGGSAEQSLIGSDGTKTVVLVFAGFPASAPQHVVAVMLDQPLAGYYTAETAQILFQSIVQEIVSLPR
jgi:cell division protein FtsI (penicillin-binding protein 3)